MKSKTKIEKQKKRKTNTELVETISLAKKNKNWLIVAAMLSMPTKKLSRVNLGKIDKESGGGETIVVIGKVLAVGGLTKKTRVAAYKISKAALEKIKDSKSEYISLKEEIKSNSKGEKIKIVS